MQRNVLETIMGAVVLVAAAVFLYVIYSGSGIKEDRGGYQLTVRFDRGGSVLPGTDVRISGVKVGAVTSQDFDPKMFQAVVTLNIRKDVELPKDSSAIITSDGLLGNYYIKLEPGAEDEILKDGDQVAYAQGALDLVELINKFVVGGSSEPKQDGSATP
ncbi:outer membrane lipid asymmetry maintenance protein MlaD [Dongia sp.]|uniref:outer membrane lipid asymmetry maintenance protein MlaD n=1 Tax=Dongia sp. TaxID=1977262 RepID=UPI0035B38940